MRLIDADLIYDKIMNFTIETEIWSSDTPEQRMKKVVDDIVKYYKNTISEAPTVDAVPIVRCKDCEYLGNKIDYLRYVCNKRQVPYCYLTDFCLYGERKMEEQK